MNALWKRAKTKGLLQSRYEVLERELRDMVATTQREIDGFERLGIDHNAETSMDVCRRILDEAYADLVFLQGQNRQPDAIDGEKSLKTLYQRGSAVVEVWTAENGQQPVDVIIVLPDAIHCVMGDCKFGLKSDATWMLWNEDQFKHKFSNKFQTTGRAITKNDRIIPSPKMLLIVTSSMVELLKNRIDDYKLDSRYNKIPYDDVVVCSVKGIHETDIFCHV